MHFLCHRDHAHVHVRRDRIVFLQKPWSSNKVDCESPNFVQINEDSPLHVLIRVAIQIHNMHMHSNYEYVGGKQELGGVSYENAKKCLLCPTHRTYIKIMWIVNIYYLEGREGHRLPNTPPIVVCINSCPDRRARTAPLLSLELSTLHTIRALRYS